MDTLYFTVNAFNFEKRYEQEKRAISLKECFSLVTYLMGLVTVMFAAIPLIKDFSFIPCGLTATLTGYCSYLNYSFGKRAKKYTEGIKEYFAENLPKTR